MSTVIKKLQVLSRNRSLFISEVGKIVRLLLLSQATSVENDGIFSALKRVKIYLKSTMIKKSAARSNVGACSQ